MTNRASLPRRSLPACSLSNFLPPNVLAIFGGCGILLLVLLSPLSCGDQEQFGGVDLILIIDTSMSMRGVDGGADIYEEVQETCKELVRDVGYGNSVTIVSFDTDAHVYPRVVIADNTDRERVYGQIDQIPANGKYTYTAKALESALNEANRLQERSQDYRQVVVILTDGKNDPPPGANGDLDFADVTSPYKGKPWYVYYVQLGDELDPDLRSALKRDFPNNKTIHDAKGANLNELAREVSKEFEEPKEPSTWPYWVGGALLGLVLSIVIWRIIAAQMEKRLFGSLDCWPSKGGGSKTRFEDLSESGRSTTIGASGLVLPDCTEDVARMGAEKVDDEVLVFVEPLGDSKIMFKNRQEEHLVLYSGDEFTAGSWSFRYRGATGRRPRA